MNLFQLDLEGTPADLAQVSQLIRDDLPICRVFSIDVDVSPANCIIGLAAAAIAFENGSGAHGKFLAKKLCLAMKRRCE